MATVYITARNNKNGKSYYVYYMDPYTSKKVHYRTFQKKKDAASEAAKLRRMIDTQDIHQLQKQRKKHRPMTFSEVGALCRKEWEKDVACGEMSSETLKGYTTFLKLTEEVLGDAMVWDLTEDKIKEFRTDVAIQLSPSSSNRRLFIVKVVLKKALKEGAVAMNVAQPLNYLDERTHCRTKYLIPSTLDKLLAACEKSRAKYLTAMVLLGAEHGAARQEILDLSWEDIDFESDTIFFFRKKNGAKRTMSLMSRTKKALLEWREHLAKARRRKKIVAEDDHYVFCHLDGARMTEFKSSWATVRRKTGLVKFHFHDLRHTFATSLLSSGSDMKEVKEYLGHQDIRSTDRYTHLSLQRKQSVKTKLEEYYAGAAD